jgi:hypothetical protein
MTAAQRQAWDRARARIAVLQPAIALAVVKVFDLILDALPESKLTETIRDGALDDIIAVLLAQSVLERVTLPFRLALRDAIARSFRFSVPALPNGGKVNGTIAVVFDQLNPRVIAAMRTLETRAVTDLTESARDTVRQSIARGLENRQRPSVIARELRAVIGLAPKDEAAVANFRAMLDRGDRTALSRLLRDRRFDQTLERSLGADGKGLTAKQIDAMTAAYRRRAIAANAETVSRAATRSAYKLGVRQTWEAALDRGVVPGGVVNRRWLHLDGQDNPRPHHEAMQGQTVPIDAPYSNGDTFAGEHDPWNCHCIDLYLVA